MTQTKQRSNSRWVSHWFGAFGFVLLTAIQLNSHASAAELTPAQVQFFENKIRPILSDNCYSCHSLRAERIRGALLLDSRDALSKGGNNGPIIVPGDPEKSLLIKAVRYTDPDLQMPPKDKKLSDAQIADLVAWVKMGAPDPRTGNVAGAKPADASKKHWAFQRVSKPPVPEVKDASWVKTPIDNFILAKLEEKDLKPNPPTDKTALIRRATFDLTGLPPTSEEVDDFLKDESPDAFAKVVDRLLASPQYGERWGRHWLDVARYSDTKGQVKRNREDPNYPFAWSYRDYVVRSFNEDKPYNNFIVEQIAADRIPLIVRNQTNLAAMGFLTLGDRFMEMPNDIINDRIDVVTKGFLGLTVTCARCHDHKFDPIPTKDYYSLHGIFASSAEPTFEPVISKILSGGDYAEYYKKRMDLEREKSSIEEKFREARRSKNKQAIKPLQRQARENQSEIAKLEMTHPGAPERAMIMEDIAKPHDSAVFLRGEAGNKGPIVPRRFLEVLSGPTRPAYTNGSGRLQLAYAIANKDNPLTARVMINRLWLHHFGEGFVPTPDDFGTMSEPPSHPELLDYLSATFTEQGWSIKKMHRMIMLSSVYQESSANNPRYAQIDPFNRLLWRANIRRLEFESLRDSLLAIGGTLDKTMYGHPVDLSTEPYSTRRTIYGFVDRSDVADVLINFDFAPPDLPSGRRHETTVPQQALFLMNSPLVVESAKKIVDLPEFNVCQSDEERIEFLYKRIYQRPPHPEEIKLGEEFIVQAPAVESTIADNSLQQVSNERGRDKTFAKQAGKKRPMGKGPATMKRRAPLKIWEEYAHALIQANETSFVN